MRSTSTSTFFFSLKAESSSLAIWSSLFSRASSTATEYSRWRPPWRSRPSLKRFLKVLVIQAGSSLSVPRIWVIDGMTISTLRVISVSSSSALVLRKRRMA
jgi:hypothetical protein